MRGSLWGGARAGEMGWNLRLGLGFATGDRAGQGGTGDSRGVEAARDVGLVDHGEEFEVGPASPVAVGLAEVDVQEGFVLDGAHGVVLCCVGLYSDGDERFLLESTVWVGWCGGRRCQEVWSRCFMAQRGRRYPVG